MSKLKLFKKIVTHTHIYIYIYIYGVGDFNCWGVTGPTLVLFFFYVNVSGMDTRSSLSSQTDDNRLPGFSALGGLFPRFNLGLLPPVSLRGLERLSYMIINSIMLGVCTAKWALFRPYLRGERCGLGQRNKRTQSISQLRAKSVGEKISQRRNERWESPQKWRKVGLRVGACRERESSECRRRQTWDSQ